MVSFKINHLLEVVSIHVGDHALRRAGPVGDLVDGVPSLDLEGDGAVTKIIRADGCGDLSLSAAIDD